MAKEIIKASPLPSYTSFDECCARGLSAIYPFNSLRHPDPDGWKYETRWPPSYNAFGTMRSLMTIDAVHRLKPKTVLEVAGGGGGLAATLAKAGCRVTVNDLRVDFIAEALKEYTGGEQVKLVGGNMFDLSCEKLGKFDLVIAAEVIEHVAHPDNLLTHLKSFLKPAGCILLTTPNGAYFRNKLPTYSEVKNFDELETQQFKPDADGHLFLFTPQELIQLSEMSGLRVKRIGVWGTPVLSGHIGLRIFRSKHLTRLAYRTELLAQSLPESMRLKLCSGMTVILCRNHPAGADY